MGVTGQGLAAIVKTKGNQDLHVILRGGSKGPNFTAEHVRAAAANMAKARPKNHSSIMIDCSRMSLFYLECVVGNNRVWIADGNSQKNHNNQPKVVDDICMQLIAGDINITGVMIESHINEGRQDVPPAGASGLKHGVSITDACVNWQTTVEMLNKLDAVRLLHVISLELL